MDAFSPPALDVWTVRQMCRSLRTDRRDTRRDAWSQPPEPYGRCTCLGIRNPSLYRTSAHEGLRCRGCPDPVRVSARMRGLFICSRRKIVLRAWEGPAKGSSTSPPASGRGWPKPTFRNPPPTTASDLCHRRRQERRASAFPLRLTASVSQRCSEALSHAERSRALLTVARRCATSNGL